VPWHKDETGHHFGGRRGFSGPGAIGREPTLYPSSSAKFPAEARIALTAFKWKALLVRLVAQMAEADDRSGGLAAVAKPHCSQSAFRPVSTTVCAGGTQAILRSASPITLSALGPEAHLRRPRALGK
jgi:hypothetical protein